MAISIAQILILITELSKIALILGEDREPTEAEKARVKEAVARANRLFDEA